MQHHPQTRSYDPEDHIAELHAKVRESRRFGREDLARIDMVRIASIRDALWTDFEAEFDSGTFVAGEDRIAPDVTYTTPRH